MIRPVGEGAIKCVLVVDDDAAIRKSAITALRPRTVRVASCIAEATELFSCHAFDLAIVDVHLCDVRTGGENGIDFVRHLRKCRPSLLSVVVTGLRVGTVVDDAYQAGAVKTYEKPFDWKQVIVELEQGPATASPSPRLPNVDEWKRDYIARALNASGANVTRAASTIGVKRTSLQRLTSKLGLARTRAGSRSDDIS